MSDHTHPADGPAQAAAAQIALARGGEKADIFLDEQTHLTRLQIEQLKEENATRRRLLGLEHASAMFKLALEVAVALVAAVIVIGLATAMWNAANDNGLVVESFSVPPDMAGRGLSGDVVAAKLLDKLSMLQDETASNRAPSSYANNWGSDIKLQIPDTGVSIGEFNRSLHAWLGHQTRITGEIWRTPTGIAVTARAGSATSPTFTGADADLDKLMQKAAEAVYRATQPYRYAVYLVNAGRNKEAEDAYQALIANGSPQDRAWAYVGIENLYQARNEVARARHALYQALALRPGFTMVYINFAGLEGQLQHDEAALAAQTKAVALLRGQRESDLSPQAAAMQLPASESGLASALGDFTAQLAYDREVEAMPEFSGTVENARQTDVNAFAALHDAAGLQRMLDEMPPTNSAQVKVVREASHVFGELQLGDPAPLLAKRAMFEAVIVKLGPAGREIIRRQLSPFVAYALALSGDLKAAHATIDTTPADCVVCLRVRGRIDAFERNWRGAGYWFARATHDAPSPPFSWCDWGHMLLAKGDIDAAIAKFARANRGGPHFADPLEYWGEALIAKNRSDLALAKFAEAAKYAPNWGRLHLKWGEALIWSGYKDDARTQFAMAAGLGLSKAERAELARVER